jgi:hypothetical protein
MCSRRSTTKDRSEQKVMEMVQKYQTPVRSGIEPCATATEDYHLHFWLTRCSPAGSIIEPDWKDDRAEAMHRLFCSTPLALGLFTAGSRPPRKSRRLSRKFLWRKPPPKKPRRRKRLPMSPRSKRFPCRTCPRAAPARAAPPAAHRRGPRAAPRRPAPG